MFSFYLIVKRGETSLRLGYSAQQVHIIKKNNKEVNTNCFILGFQHLLQISGEAPNQVMWTISIPVKHLELLHTQCHNQIPTQRSCKLSPSQSNTWNCCTHNATIKFLHKDYANYLHPSKTPGTVEHIITKTYSYIWNYCKHNTTIKYTNRELVQSLDQIETLPLKPLQTQ